MSEENRRSSDGDIGQIKTQIKHLGESDDHLFAKLDRLETDTANGFNEIRELIQRQSADFQKQNQPQWGVYAAGLALVGAFLVYQIDQIADPIKEGLLALDRSVGDKIEALEGRLDAQLGAQEKLHEKDIGHLKELHDKDIQNLTRWVDRIDRDGSIVHYGPNAKPEND